MKIESEIGGGSLSIFNEKELFYKNAGFLIEKKSDYLIEVLKDSLTDNRIAPKSLKSIRYSEFPGSQTGLKILASIVKGISLPYEIDIAGKNIFGALFDFYRNAFESEFCIILPINRRESMLEYSSRKTSESKKKFPTVDLGEIILKLNNNKIKAVLPLNVFDNIFGTNDLTLCRDYENLVDIGENLSIYL